jgi:hypothetical protein
VRNGLYRDEAGKQKYLDISVKAFDDVIKRAEGELAVFIHQQQEGRKCAADALRNVQPPGHLASLREPAHLESGAQTYRELIDFLKDSCAAYDIAATIAQEIAGVLRKALPDLSAEYASAADDLKQIHVALLEEHDIPFTLPASQ